MAGVCSRLFEVESPAQIALTDKLLQEDLSWQEALRHLGTAGTTDGSVNCQFGLYQAPAGQGKVVAAGPGLGHWRTYDATDGLRGGAVHAILQDREGYLWFGTGKGLAARRVHRLSPMATGPFVQVNCGAIPEGLVESELFGHERGAFTGALSRKIGKVELAQGGTLFLDEIGDLAPAAQAKLLQVLEERTFMRVGGTETLRAEVRVIAATNRELRQMVAAGTFREDLYFRLQGFQVELPPLRQRRGDIPMLASYLYSRMRKLGLHRAYGPFP